MKKKQAHSRAQEEKPKLLSNFRLHRHGNSHAWMRSFCVRETKTTIAYTVLFFVFLFAVYWHWETIGYASRPLWDTPPKPFEYIAHYYAVNVSMAKLCSLHGWTVRHHPRRVFDAVIFNNEVDVLELRWRELTSVVNTFVIVESNTTFTGQNKPLWFAENMQRFRFVQSQITYSLFAGRALERGESPFVLESAQRVHMDKVLRDAGIAQGDLLIMADVDEIPSIHTIDLLRWCDGIPDVIHLQLNTYLYSFEFFMDRDTWRPSVHIFKPGKTEYDHGRQTDLILADAGWHCSFCFRHIEEIVFKMLAYSHVDRVKSQAFLDPHRVQTVVCEGRDLFDMLPEVYSFKELVLKSGAIPRSFSGVNLPSFLLNNSDRFKFLLPGHCVRDVLLLNKNHLEGF